MHLRFDGTGGSWHVRAAAEVIEAHAIDACAGVLTRVQAAHEAGYVIAGFVNYEFGYPCVDLNAPLRKQTLGPLLPLLWFAIIEPAEFVRGTENALTNQHFVQNSGLVTGVAEKSSHQRPDQNAAMGMQLKALVEFPAYAHAITRIHDELHAGNAYQINYSVPFEFAYSGDPLDLYNQLRDSGAPREAAYLAHSQWAIAALSPELFLAFAPGKLTTRPMKGTVRPGFESALHNAKNRAEHIMIVDLLRNDLAKLCRRVQVEELFTLEQYPTFSTLTSTISGELERPVSFAEILRALFPCGSVTGAPKRAAVALIGELETHARGAYCGSVGYILPNGVGRWNVAIRTLQFDREQNRGRLDLGGGIVADSQAVDEWAEIATKGAQFTSLTAAQSVHLHK